MENETLHWPTAKVLDHGFAKKYGVTLERTDLNLRDWLQHAYEECLDQANYLKRSIVEIDKSNEKA